MLSRLFLAASVLVAGCASPPPDPTALPRAVARVVALTDEVLTAFESDAPKAADKPLHRVGGAIGRLRKAATAALDEEQLVGVNDAIESLLDGFAALHAPMHQAQFPEDFDAAPVQQRLAAGVVALRAALPAEIASRVDEYLPKSAPPVAPPSGAGASAPGGTAFRLASQARAARAPSGI